jgi:signal transduction histidine kinase
MLHPSLPSVSSPIPDRRPRPPSRTLQLRLSATYGAAFFLLGLVVLAIPYFAGRGSAPSSVHLNTQVDTSSRLAIVAAQRGADHHQQLVLSILAVILLAAASAALGWLFAGRTLRPLREITARARDISVNNLHERLAIAGPYEELNELGATLDDLLSRLEASFASQRNFVSNASHELRTPLTAERALLQVALADSQPSVESLRAVCEELLELGVQQERLIDDLLTLAQSEAGIDNPERFDLSSVARIAVRERLEEAAARGVELEAVCVPGPVFGDRRLVSILVGNLIDNAIRHNEVSGTATVRTSHSGRGATVAVSNSGPVVAEEEVARLCEPFMRSGNRRDSGGEGHGLGLTIVQSIARAHHAELRVRARSQGGLAVDVTFPQQRQSS